MEQALVSKEPWVGAVVTPCKNSVPDWNGHRKDDSRVGKERNQTGQDSKDRIGQFAVFINGHTAAEENQTGQECVRAYRSV